MLLPNYIFIYISVCFLFFQHLINLFSSFQRVAILLLVLTRHLTFNLYNTTLCYMLHEHLFQ